MPCLYAEVEQQECQHFGALGQADFRQRPGEAETMDKPEPKGDQPRLALAERLAAAHAVDGFSSEQGDAEGDGDLDRRTRQRDAAKRSSSKCNGMGKGESGDCGQQLARTDEENQAEDEEEVVVAEEDVFDADTEIGRGGGAGGRGEVELQGAGAKHRGEIVTCQTVHAHEGVCERALKSGDLDMAGREIAGHVPALDQRAGGDFAALVRAGAILRKDRIELEAPAIEHGLFPCDRKLAGICFRDFEIGRTHFMRAGG